MLRLGRHTIILSRKDIRQNAALQEALKFFSEKMDAQSSLKYADQIGMNCVVLWSHGVVVVIF